MKTQVNYGDVKKTSALEDHVNQEVERRLKRFNDRLTRVEVHLHDDKSKKVGDSDQRCLMEARPAGRDPIVAEAQHNDIYLAIKHAAEKLERALGRRLEKDKEKE